MIVGSNLVAATDTSDIASISSKEFLDIQAIIECRFTQIHVSDMIITHSQLKKKYGEHLVTWKVTLHEKKTCQMAMIGYLQIPPNSKRYPGRKRYTLTVQIDKNLKEAERNDNLIVSKFETIEDLQKLSDIAKEGSEWTKFSNLICRLAADKT